MRYSLDNWMPICVPFALNIKCLKIFPPTRNLNISIFDFSKNWQKSLIHPIQASILKNTLN